MECSRIYGAECRRPGEGVDKALEMVDLSGALGAREVVVKVNFVSAYTELAATPVEAVEALVRRLAGRCRVIVAEAPTIGSFEDAVRRFGYSRLREYGVELVDLAGDDYEEFYVWDRNLDRRVRVRVSKTILGSRYLVSVVRPKTHDTVIVTLTLKNVVVGAILPGDRHKIHQGYKAINLSIAYLATHMLPKLSIVDGAVGMEGAGPTNGAPIELGVSLAGSDAVAVDAAAAYLMGFDPLSIGYLHYLSRWGYGCADSERIEVEGLPDWRSRVKRFEPHPTYRHQLEWRLGEDELKRVERELEEGGALKAARG